MKIVKEENFKVKTFKPKFTSTNSLINAFDTNNKILKSLNSIDVIDHNKFIMSSKTSYLNSESDLNYHQYPLSFEQNIEATNHSRFNLSNSFSLCLDNEVMNVRLNNNNNDLACGLLNGNVVILDTDTGNVKKILHTNHGQLSVSSLRWKPMSQKKNILAVSAADGSINTYNTESGTHIYKIKKEDRCQLLSLDYSIDGSLLVSGDNSGNIYLFNDDYQKEVRCFSSASWFNCGHTNRIFSLKFMSDDHNLFVSGGWEGVIYIWDVRESKVS